MIADRPGGKHGGEPAAFVPAGKSEAWGLNPTKKVRATLCWDLEPNSVSRAVYTERALDTVQRWCCLSSQMPEVDRFVPQSVTAQHVAWVQAYDEQKRAAKACEQEASAAAVARKDAFAAFSQKLRQAVLSGQDLGFWRASKHKATGTEKLLQASTRLYHEGHSMQHKEQEGSSAQCQARSAVDAAGTDVAASSQSAPDQTVKAEHRVATPQAADSQPVEPATQPSSSQAVASQTNKVGAYIQFTRMCSQEKCAQSPCVHGLCVPGIVHVLVQTSHRPASRQKASKPAWALSAQEAEAVAAQEESDLLAFAESLDYDAFVESLEDTELSQALQVSAPCV